MWGPGWGCRKPKRIGLAFKEVWVWVAMGVGDDQQGVQARVRNGLGVRVGVGAG